MRHSIYVEAYHCKRETAPDVTVSVRRLHLLLLSVREAPSFECILSTDHPNMAEAQERRVWTQANVNVGNPQSQIPIRIDGNSIHSSNSSSTPAQRSY